MSPIDSPDPATILVVDDVAINLQVLVRILEGSGYRILAARDGPGALEVARRALPDLVLLDVAMPGMDGFEVCRALKRDPATREMVVIFLSALGEVADKVSGLELGAADYVTKPFQGEEVLARVRGHLLRKRLERELRVSRDSLAGEMRSAGAMQRLLLPQSLPTNGRMRFAAYYQTSLHAGGDYYDVLPLESGHLGVMVADVSGHGADAAIVMAMVRTLLHSHDGPLHDPAGVLEGLNRHFGYLRDTPLFATALYAVISPEADRLLLASAGHPLPLLMREGQTIAPLPVEGTVPLFLFELKSIPKSDHALERGDRIVFYTDGITDRENAAGEMFGLDRLLDVLARGTNLPSEQMLDRVIGEVELFADGCEAHDDQTLLIASMI